MAIFALILRYVRAIGEDSVGYGASGQVVLPPISKLAATLRTVTERLAHELAAPSYESPSWSEFEWRIARAVAAMHGISSLLYTSLRWEGPIGWQHFLREQREQSVGRHGQILRSLAAIESQATLRCVEAIALKGAALYANGIYASGERPMGDIDLLVRPKDLSAVSQVLEACGYLATFSSRRHQVFEPRDRKISTGGHLGEHVDNPIKIEVHIRIAEHLPITEVDVTEFIFPRKPHAGLNSYPSLANLMIHLLLHAAGNMRAHALRLIQLHDIARLAERFRPSDWAELLRLFADARPLGWAFAPAMLTARYYPTAIPAGVIERLKRGCPRLLRRTCVHQKVTGVSWSNIRIAAFPGLMWSRTPLEAVEFMRSRIWPNHEARSELKVGAEQIPDSSTVPWYGLPHGARILRWVFSKPPRVQTLLSVRAALEHRNL